MEEKGREGKRREDRKVKKQYVGFGVVYVDLFVTNLCEGGKENEGEESKDRIRDESNKQELVLTLRSPHQMTGFFSPRAFRNAWSAPSHFSVR
jgi:hypothetical protein